MTQVTYEKEGLRLCLRGHAGGEKGRDLVCAAESILLFSLIDWLYRREELMRPMVYLSDGSAELRCRPRSRRNIRRCREVMEAFVRGFEILNEKYPDRVEVIDPSSGASRQLPP